MTEFDPENEPVHPEFLKLYNTYVHSLRERGILVDEDAEQYVMTFLRRGSAVVRQQIKADPDRDDIILQAEEELVRAADDIAAVLQDRERVRREDMEVAFQSVCGTGYPPFCGGPGGGAPSTDPGGTGPEAKAASEGDGRRYKGA